MRFGSVCSGIEAASVAFGPLGWSAAWFSEIEPFPCAVLARHYPDVPNLGDMRALPRRIASGEIEAPDLLCGGTPCQAFSVAGLRKSLDDARGNLSLTFCEIANAIDHARAGSPPAVILWENVPGVFSTADNAFGCFLAGLAGEDDALQPAGGKWSNAGAVYGPRRTVAWRTLDAQYFGLAQRRRRVFVVASARDDFDPVSVLFEFDGVRRDSAPRRNTREDVAGCLDARAAGGGFPGSDGATAGHVVGVDYTNGSLGGDLCGTIEAAQSKVNRGQGVLHAPEVARCVATREGSSRDWETTTMIAFNSREECVSSEHVFGSLGSSSPQSQAVAFQSSQSGVRVDDVHATLDSNNGSRRHNGALFGRRVRRLTPRECERLQGFPDDYTLIPHRGKPVADGPRYKAIGNSWAVPCVRWIGARIQREV